MPNSRRRRFSVQNNVGGRDGPKMQNRLQISHQEEEDSKKAVTNILATRSKNKMFSNTSKNSSSLEIVAECESSTSTIILNKTTEDKDVTASSSNIDLFNILNSDEMNIKDSPPKARDARPQQRDRTPIRRDKYPRQHRIKVRSPKRRLPMPEQKTDESNRKSIASGPIDWEQEEEVYVDNVPDLAEPNEEHVSRVSNDSIDDMCRICHSGEALTNDLGQLISACSCRGTVGRVHVKCLERWLTESGKSRCELCGIRYITKRVHRYGVPRALIMWVLSQNAKQVVKSFEAVLYKIGDNLMLSRMLFKDIAPFQLMVDSLGIMLMSPLAVLAAWLTGRTLAGLMSQDNQVTPWPLASTFVLACMTLVCYYCWIVSAATRHALGWWIWYRSQYEVRLQFQEVEE